MNRCLCPGGLDSIATAGLGRIDDGRDLCAACIEHFGIQFSFGQRLVQHGQRNAGRTRNQPGRREIEVGIHRVRRVRGDVHNGRVLPRPEAAGYPWDRGVHRNDQVGLAQPFFALHSQVHRVIRTQVDRVRPGLHDGQRRPLGEPLQLVARAIVNADGRRNQCRTLRFDQHVRERFDGGAVRPRVIDGPGRCI